MLLWGLLPQILIPIPIIETLHSTIYRYFGPFGQGFKASLEVEGCRRVHRGFIIGSKASWSFFEACSGCMWVTGVHAI